MLDMCRQNPHCDSEMAKHGHNMTCPLSFLLHIATAEVSSWLNGHCTPSSAYYCPYQHTIHRDKQNLCKQELQTNGCNALHPIQQHSSLRKILLQSSRGRLSWGRIHFARCWQRCQWHPSCQRRNQSWSWSRRSRSHPASSTTNFLVMLAQ